METTCDTVRLSSNVSVFIGDTVVVPERVTVSLEYVELSTDTVFSSPLGVNDNVAGEGNVTVIDFVRLGFVPEKAIELLPLGVCAAVAVANRLGDKVLFDDFVKE